MKVGLSKRSSKVISLLIIGCFFMIVFFINTKTPIWSDDWAFYVSYQNKHLHSVADVLSSIGYFYSHVNGRSLANFIVVLFAYLGKNIFNFFNALMFVALGCLVYRFSMDSWKIKPLGLAGVFLLLWFFLPVPNQTIFWMCASVVYLWMSVVVLLFFLPFRNLFFKNKNFLKNDQLGIFLIFIFGLLAGNSHELLAPIIFLIILFIGYTLMKRKEKIPRWFYGGMGGFLIGAIAQFVAPGNYQKLGHDASDGGIFFQLMKGLWNMVKKISSHQIILWELVGAIILLYLFNKLFLKRPKKIADPFMFFLLVVAIGLDVLGIFFPYFPPRALFFGNLALILFLARFLLVEEFVILKYLIVIIFIPIFIFSATTSIRKANKLFIQYQKRDMSILHQKAIGELNIKVKKIKKIKDRMLLGEPLMRHSNNFWPSRFYGVDTINLD